MKKTRKKTVYLCGMILTAMLAFPMVAEASDVKFDASSFPDSNFREAIRSAYPELLDDGSLSDDDVEKILTINIRDKNVKSVEGIEYFDSVRNFYCGSNPISELPILPDSIVKLECKDCNLTVIKQLPKNLAYLNCANNKITSLPKLHENLVEVNVSNNRLKTIKGSFDNIVNFFASDNRLEGTFDARTGDHIFCLVLSNNRLTRVVIPEGHTYSNLDVRENFLYSKSYVVNEDGGSVRFQFTPQRKDHVFSGYKRVSRASTAGSGWKTATCKDCEFEKKLEIPQIKSIKLSYSKVTYNGKKKTPSVVIKNIYGKELKKGTDYTAIYGSTKRSAVGRYSVKVTFKGNYKGTKTLWFTIVPKAPVSLKAKKTSADGKPAVKLTWSKVSNATGYYVHVKQGNGTYKLNKTVKSKSTVTTTVKNLKKGKKYTFKITPYYKSKGGTKYKSIAYKTVVKST